MTSRHLAKPSLRSRGAVLAVGLGASMALGAGAAVAAPADATPLSSLSSTTDQAVAAQAASQHEAGDAAASKAAAARKAAEKKAAAWVTPVTSYVLGEPYGVSGNLWAHRHSGQDFVVPTGTPVRAAHAGTVVKAGPDGGGDGPAYGNAVVVEHAPGIYTQYAHLSRIDVRVGEHVGTGQHLALSGSTGNSTGPHLHFEVRYGPDYGQSVEPLTFLEAHGLTA